MGDATDYVLTVTDLTSLIRGIRISGFKQGAFLTSTISMFFSTIDPAPEQVPFIPRAVKSFGRVCGRLPLGAAVQVAEAPQDLMTELKSLVEDTNRSFVHGLIDFAEQRHRAGLPVPKIVLGTREHSRLAIKCRELNPVAEWGIGINHLLAVVYGPLRPSIVWHEAFHLLGAFDCYDATRPDERPGPTCGCTTCIMGYEPLDLGESVVPLLCEGNIRAIQTQLRLSSGVGS